MDKEKCLLIEHKHLSLQQSLITLHYSPGTILAGWQKDTKLLSINVGEKTWQIIRPGRNIEKVGFFLFLLAFQWLIVFDRVGKCREGEWNHFTTIFKIDFCFVPTQNCHLNYDNKEINSDMKYKEKWKISLKLKKKYDLPASSHNRHSFPPAAEEKDSIKNIFYMNKTNNILKR